MRLLLVAVAALAMACGSNQAPATVSSTSTPAPASTPTYTEGHLGYCSLGMNNSNVVITFYLVNGDPSPTCDAIQAANPHPALQDGQPRRGQPQQWRVAASGLPPQHESGADLYGGLHLSGDS